EFGHALGLLHEQSYPGAIKWNKDTVYKYYQKTQGWDKSKIDFNVLQASNQFYTNGTQYDPKSIMHYSVEAWQTLDGYSLPANFDLSASDKANISAFYPKDGLSPIRELPRVNVFNFTDIQVVNDSVRGGIAIYPSFELTTSDKLGSVYVVAMLVDENDYYVKDNNNYYNWGGIVAAYPKLILLPNTKMSYNKSSKNLELFLPYDEIPLESGKKVKFRFTVVLQDVENNQLVYVMNHFTKTLFSINK
ncbi:MAG: M12 family metallopeptidase, partial [Chitinophagaceae bacterium]